MTAPVTVSVTRHVDPSRSSEMLAWVQAGTSLAEKFDGFLGSGWVRPSEDSADWHMLYRFADADALARWEASPQREWWLEAAQGQIESSRVERRTGIEGWFDEPAAVESLSAAPVAPPRWKQMVVIFMGFFPLSLAVNALVGAMVGLERSTLPLIGDDSFGVSSSVAVLSFIVTFGLAKSFTNLGAGTLAERIGRRRLLIAGWLVALPVPLLIGVAPSWAWVVVANLFLGVNQGLAWSMTVVMKIDLVGPDPDLGPGGIEVLVEDVVEGDPREV